MVGKPKTLSSEYVREHRDRMLALGIRSVSIYVHDSDRELLQVEAGLRRALRMMDVVEDKNTSHEVLIAISSRSANSVPDFMDLRIAKSELKKKIPAKSIALANAALMKANDCFMEGRVAGTSDERIRNSARVVSYQFYAAALYAYAHYMEGHTVNPLLRSIAVPPEGETD